MRYYAETAFGILISERQCSMYKIVVAQYFRYDARVNPTTECRRGMHGIVTKFTLDFLTTRRWLPDIL